MTLEDDIRRMAEARAAEVDDVPWRDRLGGAGGPRWGWIVAAAAVVALVVGTVVVLAGDDDPADTEVAGDGTTVPSTTAAVTTTSAATTTTAETTTTAPGACAAEAPEGVLDTATHLDFNRTPLDLDLDGVNDELFTYEDDNADAWVIARTADGWTAPAFIGPVLPRLVFNPDGFPAGADLDDDGGLEFFVSGFEDETAVVVSFAADGCDLTSSFPDDPIIIAIGLPPDACDDHCFTRVSCLDDALLVESTLSRTPPGPIEDPYDIPWSWFRYELRIVDGAAAIDELPAISGNVVTDIDPDAPTAETTGFIDCTPPTPSPAEE